MPVVHLIMIGKTPAGIFDSEQRARDAMASIEGSHPGIVSMLSIPINEIVELQHESRKVVLNHCFGGFSLSAEAKQMLFGIAPDLFNSKGSFKRGEHELRADPRLVSVVEQLGDRAGGEFSRLVVVEVPAHVESWNIKEHDGLESILEDGWEE
jgi:hypothetical protein